MSQTIHLNADNKAGRYAELLPQIRALIADEPDQIANFANTTAVLKEAFGWFWVGFYLVKNKELVLGPFQGPLACTRIGYGKGVCGQAWAAGETIIVDDVNVHPGHIACSSLSQSEIVVPLKNAGGEVTAVLDVDADTLAQFDADDAAGLEAVCRLLAERHEAV
ncbi:MAG: GAF domain-containing protein [Neisseria sp.]|nr:GAF domain-containing protein [Neisseria sp.]